ncbi:Ribosome assembly factor mrt4 [Rhizoctonia solani]|uniref:Ribosome assembly factor mrt4 n=1 Tax=Rhizoctonia solani TaxID=456999 RepID=A0A8H7M561_9AGAM|nr:Ribosome assembly factor mrt4 [Rhizoctonia solani]
MPRSKRSKVVSLTKTEKKTKAHKEELISQIRENAQKWKYAWVFSVGDMRNAALKDIRTQWKGHRVYPEEEVRPGLHVVTKYIHSGAGIFFTDWDPKETLEWFKDYKKPDFARAGNVATREVVLPEGPVCDQTPSPDPPTPLAHALEPRLTTTWPLDPINGQQLTAEQAALLRLLGIQMTEFRIKCICWWGEEEGLTELEADTQAASGGEDEGESENDDMDS